MRKLKLQMQLSADGFIAGPNGELDWMNMNWDDASKNYVLKLTEPVDCIVMGRKLAEGFIPYWASAAADPKNADVFAHKMNDIAKIVFSKTLKTADWPNTKLAANVEDEITRLKNQAGGDIIVYGGANFAANLIKANLVDELNLFYNPVAIGEGMRLFTERTNLQLVSNTVFSCGIVAVQYKPTKK